MKCRLCDGVSRDYHEYSGKLYWQCENCRAVFLAPEFYIDPHLEQSRYLEHNNDVTDPRYQEFVSPITLGVKENFPVTSKGLDYGCGTGPVAAVELEKSGYHVALYDPYFAKNPEALRDTYDFIICCEVMEHFHDPYMEFSRLHNLLLPQGKLFCKTTVFSEKTDFSSWYYKNDPTHVFFYTPESLEWIKQNLGFRGLKIEPKLITFSR